MRFTRRKIRASAVLCAAVLGGALLAGAPASAAPRAAAAGGWTVTPGGAFSTSGVGLLTDDANGAQWVCGYSTSAPLVASGTLAVGAVPAGQSVGVWSSVPSFTCSGPLGIVMTVTVGGLPWHLDATAYDAETDTTTGVLTGMSWHWSGLGALVDFDGPGGAGSGTGTETFSYDNATRQLVLGRGDMEAYNVSGTDLGLLNDGDSVDLGVTLPLAPAQTIRPDSASG